MIIDSTLEFCDAVSIAASAGTALVGNQIDLSILGQDVGYDGLYLVITVDTAIITGGSAGTIRFKLASDDSASISTTTSTVHLQTGEFVTDDSPTIPAGSILFVGAVPAGKFSHTGDANTYERYLGLLCVTTTTTTTAGKINAFLTYDPPAWAPAPAAI